MNFTYGAKVPRPVLAAATLSSGGRGAIAPLAGVESVLQRVQRGDRRGGLEIAVPGFLGVRLAQQPAGSGPVDLVDVPVLLFDGDQLVVLWCGCPVRGR